jgi:hypothetical protein
MSADLIGSANENSTIKSLAGEPSAFLIEPTPRSALGQ